MAGRGKENLITIVCLVVQDLLTVPQSHPLKRILLWDFLVTRWLRILVPTQGMLVRSLMEEPWLYSLWYTVILVAYLFYTS